MHAPNDKIPYLSPWKQHRRIIFSSLVPLFIHQVCLSISGQDCLSSFAIFLLYFVVFAIIIIRQTRMFRYIGHQYGFLNAHERDRDRVRTFGVMRLYSSLLKASCSRTFMMVFLTYDHSKSPASILTDWTWWLRLLYQIGLYEIVLDFWFYWYHRVMHEVMFLWRYHRTHHLTKYPLAELASYADHEQELFDMVGIPITTYFTLRAIGLSLGFYEWWICNIYVLHAEALGHSGVRVYGTVPSTFSWLLRALDVEMVVEDHDLHHREGWRKSFNYGKQSRLWDRIFGTCQERVELGMCNVDYTNQVEMPIF